MVQDSMISGFAKGALITYLLGHSFYGNLYYITLEKLEILSIRQKQNSHLWSSKKLNKLVKQRYIKQPTTGFSTKQKTNKKKVIKTNIILLIIILRLMFKHT